MHSTGGKIIYLRLPSEQVCIFSIILIWLVSKSIWFFIISVLKVLNIRGPIVVEYETTNNFDRASVDSLLLGPESYLHTNALQMLF